MRLGIGIALACCVMAASPAAAMTGEELLNDCEGFLRVYKDTGPDTFEYVGRAAARCYSYMSAVVDFLPGVKFGNMPMTCPPAGAQLTQFIRIFVNYGRQHPERLNERPPRVMLNALAQAFPCKH